MLTCPSELLNAESAGPGAGGRAVGTGSPFGVTAGRTWGCDREPAAEVSLLPSVFIQNESPLIFGYRRQCKGPLGQHAAQSGLGSPRCREDAQPNVGSVPPVPPVPPWPQLPACPGTRVGLCFLLFVAFLASCVP